VAEVRSDCVRVFGPISALRDLDESTDSPAISRLDLDPNPSHSSAKDFCHGLLAQAIAMAADLQSWAYGMDWAPALNGNKRAEFFERSRRIITETVEPLMAAVKAHFRKLIGVAEEQ